MTVSAKRRTGGPVLTVPPPANYWFLARNWVDFATFTHLTGRSSRTFARMRVAGIDDQACLAVLQAHCYGILPSPAWHGWLIAPDGSLGHCMGKRPLSGIRPAHLASMSDAHAEARAVRRDNDALRALVRSLRSQLDLQAERPTGSAAANDDAYNGPQLALRWP